MARKRIDIKYVEMLKNGDESAFEIIYAFYKNPLYFFVMSLVRNEADAEDVVQESFMQIMQSIPSLRNNESFHPWLYRIAYNRAMLVHKKKEPLAQSDTVELLENLSNPKMNPDLQLSAQEIVNTVKSEISKMSGKHTQVAQLYYFDELTTREISKIMKIPEGTVKTRLNKVRNEIKPALLAKGVSPSNCFSLALSPVFFKTFQLLIQQNVMPEEAATRVYDNVAPSIHATLGASSAGFLSSFSLTTKIVTMVALGGTGAYGLYQAVESVPSTINQISYHQAYTNKDIEVEFSFDYGAKEEIKVLYDNKDVAFEEGKDKITFIAKNNGVYTIQNGKQQEEINIENIDRMYPKLETTEYKNETLYLSMSDDLSGIDYATSYAEYNGNRFPIQKDGSIKGVFEKEIVVSLYDQVGNMSKYVVDIEPK